MAAKLKMSRLQWLRMGRELKRRGAGRRESGAFLLTGRDTIDVKLIVYYDDLDPHCLDKGYIDLDGAAFIPLWDLCEKKGLKVIADVHTHPTSWTKQSQTDIENPMVPIKGHFSLIVPRYAKSLLITLRGIGIFEYESFHKWRTWTVNSGVVSLTLP